MPGMKNTMGEFKAGTLKSGSGAPVRNRKQAIAIGLNQQRKAGIATPKPPNMVNAVRSKLGLP